MSTDWFHATTQFPNAGLVCLLAGGAFALAFLGYQTWRCRRRHVDVDLADDLTGEDFIAWDEDAPPAATPAGATEAGHDRGRAAS